MILTIEVKEVNALRKTCALMHTKCDVWTWTAEVSQVEITEEDGRELDPKSAWHLARSFDLELQSQELKTS